MLYSQINVFNIYGTVQFISVAFYTL